MTPDQIANLEFGRDGMPFYFDDPYDNPRRVINTLEQSVGVGNFHYLVQAGSSSEEDGLFGGSLSNLLP